MYYRGEGVKQDYDEAAKWYAKAAAQGLAAAQFDLGAMYEDGTGVPQDYKEALKWYSKAADQGNTGALFNLGLIYYLGEGVPQDYTEAAKWYTKAAEQGDTDAQYNLGLMYEKGRGCAPRLPINIEVAHQSRRARRYAWPIRPRAVVLRGHRGPQDFGAALAWFYQGREQVSPGAKDWGNVRDRRGVRRSRWKRRSGLPAR